MMKINNIIVAGSGTMGYSIAEILAEFGYSVSLYDISGEALDKARMYIQINRESLNKNKSQIENNESMSKDIIFTNNKDCFKDGDLVIECIVENLDIKGKFYEEICELAKSHTILATNTSGLSINEIAKSVSNPERFIGMHWFNPPVLVPLIEIIKGTKTSDEVAKAIYDLSTAINKHPVIVKKDVPGFVGNRIQFAILREALALIEDDVVDADGIDDIMKYGLGFRYACAGPLEIADFGGLGTFYHISEYLMKDLASDSGVPSLLADLYVNGYFGVKTGKGFHDYSEGKDKAAIEKRNVNFAKLYNALYSK
jgi:3-hydroxybutyryl-CoA dehydrogenase